MNIIDLDVLGRGITNEDTRNILLYLNLEHRLMIMQSGRVTVLKPNDMLLVNSKTPHRVQCSEGLYVRCSINIMKMKSLFPGKRLHFLCDSTITQDDNYDILRDCMKRLLRCRYEPNEFRQLKYAQESYGFLIFLMSNFRLSQLDTKEDTIAEKMIDYIDLSFREELTLKQISSDFHMTPQYFSKYFKQTVGVNYYKYLTKIRLENATEMLLRTNEQILTIALSSGFPNAEAFNRNFQTGYGCTPQEYRSAHRKTDGAESPDEEKHRRKWERAIAALGTEEPQKSSSRMTLEVDPANARPSTAVWAKLINLRDFAVLRDVSIREQLGILQESIHYEYARIHMDFHMDETSAAFFEAEQALDYLRSLQLKFWLVITLDKETSADYVEAQLREFISYMGNRFSINGMRASRFELVFGEELRRDPAQCWILYLRFFRLLEHFGCSDLVGFNLSLGDMALIQQFYRTRPSGIPLPMQTFQVEPYLSLDTEEGAVISRTTDSSYFKNRIMTLRQVIPEIASGEVPLYITSWTNTVERCNILNDSCFRGAEIIKNVIDSIDYVQAFSPGTPLDLMETDALKKKLLFGSEGLINRNGINKPSFYSYAFLSRTARYMVTKNSNMIAFCNENNLQIVCHNCKRLGYRYYLEEKNLDLERITEYFDDLEPLQIRFKLRGIPDGDYIIKFRLISPEHGSVQHILHETLEQSNIYIHPNDIKYLRQVSVPNLKLQKMTVRDGKAEINIELPGNAFAHIHVIYQF